jgi:hypothetical protein
MKKSRRELLKTIPACVAGAAVLPTNALLAAGAKTELVIAPHRPVYRPLDKITIHGAGAAKVLTVTDGQGREYFRTPATAGVEVVIAGALGTHCVVAMDADDRIVGRASLQVDCRTELRDEGGYYARLLDMLRWTMESWAGHAPVRVARFNDQTYYFFVDWLRDHTHTMKGMKYFWPELKSAVDLYADTQRDDGMIFDNVNPRTSDYNYWDWILTDGKFILHSRDKRWEMHRQPVEADVEYLFVEAIYYTWKATGDDTWMAGKLDAAMWAIRYSMTDRYRWSQKYQLIKRGYTIDTWDFVPEGDQIRGQNQVVDPEKTHFGIMFGDNTGTIASCRYLAAMLEYAGRSEDASRFRKTADDLQLRLDTLAWNGEFYRHHVPEDPSYRRDLGVDESRQVSLSNAYSLNRGISSAQAASIIRTYQRIRQEMPAACAGEFFAIYPPYKKGFDKDNTVWEYMNAGVLSLVAGELAHGAFENGFEAYGVDILRRQKEVAEKHNGFLPVVLRGKPPEAPPRTFATISLKAVANADFGAGAQGVVGWLDEPENNLSNMPVGRQVFHDIPFDVADPASNGRRGCVGLSWAKGYEKSARVKVGKTAASLYLLHAASHVQPAYGAIRLHYADGSAAAIYVDENTLGSWWEPADPPRARVAWHGPNQQFGKVGVYVSGYANPHPEKVIESIELEPLQNGLKWLIAGLTLCDAPVFFAPKDDVSFGIPEGWGAAAVVYALVEGLCGVKDVGIAFNKVQISPRWTAAGVPAASCTIRYSASQGYVSYEYRHDAARKVLHLTASGNAQKLAFSILLPERGEVTRVNVNGAQSEFRDRKIQQSTYVEFEAGGPVVAAEIVLK